MYSAAQYQSYPSTYTSEPAVGHSSLQNSHVNYQTIPMESHQSEAAPPYSESCFPTQIQQSYQREQMPVQSSAARASQMNQPNSYELCRVEPQYRADHYDVYPDTNPFRRTTRIPLPYCEGDLPNKVDKLHVQDVGYSAKYSSYACVNLPMVSPLPPTLQYHDSKYQPSPSTATKGSDSLTCEQQILERALEFCHNPTAPPPSNPLLSRPVAIPQTIPGSGQAFTRAWAPSLSNHGITPSEFLAFIDGLNIVSSASPPLQVLNLAGGFLGMVPHHWAALAGFAIQVSAQLGTAAVSKGRTELYMKEANEKFFAPRKLKVAIARREAVGAVLRLPKEDPILVPLSKDTMPLGMVERSLEAIKGYAAELDFNVPPPAEQTTVLAKMSARQIERQRKNNERKMLKERETFLEKDDKEKAKFSDKRDKERGRRRSDNDSSSSNEERKPKSNRELKRQESRERKERKRKEKAEKEAEKRNRKKGKDKEVKMAGKLLWLLIENL